MVDCMMVLSYGQPETNHAVNSNNFRNWWRKFCFISTVRASIISFYFFLLSLSLYNALGAVRGVDEFDPDFVPV